MDNQTYLNLSSRTAAPASKTPILHSRLMSVFRPIMDTGYLADYAKREYFYLDAKAAEKFIKNDQAASADMFRFARMPTGDEFINLTDKQIDLYHAILGMQSELAEITHEFMNSITEGRDVDDVNFAEESGDMLWYVALKLRALNSDFGTVMRKNIAKLQKRYRDKFTPDEAVNRDVDGERKILEDGNNE